MSTPAVTVTYFLEVVSSWCHWSEPMWAELQARYAGRAAFTCKIALMQPADFPVSRAQCDWFYRRSGTIMRSPTMLHSGWWQAERQGDYTAPNLVAEAARALGITDDRVRLALSRAAVLEGQPIGELDVAVRIAAAAGGLVPETLRAQTLAPATLAAIEASTAEFSAHQINQRPAFILTDAIGDKAVFSGLVRLEPLAATLDAMLADCAGYASHAAHWGGPPAR